MTRTYRVLCESHLPNGDDNPEWHELRKTGVTATDAATLMTGGSWIDLWMRKTGRAESTYDARNERMQWGHWMEPVTLKAYASELYANREVRPSGDLIQSPDFPWVLSTLDAETLHPEHNWIPLDAKNTDKFMEDAWADGPPEKFLWQTRHQAIAAGDAPASSLAVTVGGNRLMWADDIQTPANRTRLLEVTERFWWHVENDVIPNVADALPETKKALDAFYTPDPKQTIRLNGEYISLDEEYLNVCAELKMGKKSLEPLEQRKGEIENRFRLGMGNNAFADLGGGVLWKLKRVERKGFTVEPTNYNRISRKGPK